MNYKNYISVDVSKRFGRPIITGTRIAVSDVLNWLANGMTESEILMDFPDLTLDQIKACLLYVAEKESNTRVA